MSVWKRCIRWIAIGLLAGIASVAVAAPPPGLGADFGGRFDARVEQVKQHEVPGMAIAIIDQGKIVQATELRRAPAGRARRGGCGHDLSHRLHRQSDHRRRAGDPRRRRQACYKDDKVIDHLPDCYKRADPWVTREMTVRDLLVHRSGLGLGAGDLLFVPRHLTQPRRHRALRCATSSRPPASAVVMPTTTFCTSSPAN